MKQALEHACHCVLAQLKHLEDEDERATFSLAVSPDRVKSLDLEIDQLELVVTNRHLQLGRDLIVVEVEDRRSSKLTTIDEDFDHRPVNNSLQRDVLVLASRVDVSRSRKRTEHVLVAIAASSVGAGVVGSYRTMPEVLSVKKGLVAAKE